MPIKVPNDLPAIEILTKENVFVMTDTRAITQDVRPLHILLLNLMPTKIDTETQITRMLSNTPLQVELELLQTATHKSHVTSEEHMLAFYKTFDDIKDEFYDGMIITGAPIELMEFEEVDYWDELCEIMEWSKTHVHSTFHICWGAQAGLYYHYGIKKRLLPKKLSGVFKHEVLYKKSMLFRGFDDEFYVPQSRHTTVYAEDIENTPGIKILSTSEEAGVFCVKSDNDRQIFVTGHTEYDWNTLLNEYMRDKNKGLNPEKPAHYFPDDDDSKRPIVRWRSSGSLLFSNWLNYFVYQSTPYDIKLIHNEDLAPILKNKSELTVAKFGGSSLASAEKIKNAAALVRRNTAAKYIVVSAPGTDGNETVKVTDLLIKAFDEENNFIEILNSVRDRFSKLAVELNSSLDINAIFDEIASKYKNILEQHGSDSKLLRDYLVSRGEYVSAKLMAEQLGFDFVDAKEVIRFDDEGYLDEEKTADFLKKMAQKHEHAVIPGFYGSNEKGEIITFSRGGSDITGSLIAAATHADLYENWTDVHGLLMADPRIVKNPLSVPVINYKELRELALRGTEVLHEDAVKPVRKFGIPINIKSTFEPDLLGTMIVNNADAYKKYLEISSITGRKGFASILIEREKLNDDSSYRKRIQEVLDSYNIEVEGEQLGLDSFSVVVNSSSVLGCDEELTEKLRSVTDAEEITISTGLATIAIVGRNISGEVSVAMKIFEALSNAHVNVKFIDHAPKRISVQVGVAESDYQRAIRAIYNAFVVKTH